MTAGKVSIVILNWNQWDVTLHCLNSLRLLDYHNYEVIVVDNDSAAPPPEEIYLIIPDAVIIRNKANYGFGKGNNPGIARAIENGAEFVWLLNNDTVVMPDTLTLLVKKISESDKTGAAGTEIWDFDNMNLMVWGGGKVNMRRFYTTHLQPGDATSLDYITAASILLRTAALKQTGLFDEKFFMYWEDVDLCLRLKKCGWSLTVADGAKVLHMEGCSSESVIRDCYSFRSVIYFASKYADHYVPALLWIVFDRIIKKLMMLKFIWFLKFIYTGLRLKQTF
jgi:GT2 family glycosyltransferase